MALVTEIFGKNEIGIQSRARVLTTGRMLSDTWVQDQYTDIVDRFLTRKLGTATLAADLAFNDRTIELDAGHNFVAGNMIEIDDGDTKQYQSRVKSVNVNTLTVLNPLCYSFTTDANVQRVTQDGNVDGSSTPIIFSIVPPAGVEWDINIMSVSILDADAMDDGRFGGISGPIDGVVYRCVNDGCNNIFTAVDNGCYIRHTDWAVYSSKAPGGEYGFNAKRNFNSQNGDGVSVRIGGPDVHEFQAVIADDLTGLTRFWNVIRGHVVE